MHALHYIAISLAAVLITAGCSTGVSKGKLMTDYLTSDTLLIGLSSYSVTNKENRQGLEVPGLLIDGVCLIRNRQEFEAARCPTYAIVREVVTRGLLTSRFWEQVRERRRGPGAPIYHTDMISVVFVSVDDTGRIRDHHTRSGAHFAISVSTNEFTKQSRLD